MKARQCKDVPDLDVLRAIDRIGASLHEVTGQERAFPVAFTGELVDALLLPPKLVRAKCEGLIRRGLVDGCTCGCRGDFKLTDKGRALLPPPAIVEDPRNFCTMSVRRDPA